MDLTFFETHSGGELVERIDGDVGKLVNFLWAHLRRDPPPRQGHRPVPRRDHPNNTSGSNTPPLPPLSTPRVAAAILRNMTIESNRVRHLYTATGTQPTHIHAGRPVISIPCRDPEPAGTAPEAWCRPNAAIADS